ncbi:MAG: bifunctional DNA primase/polymerase [Gammaproteobacteria bacterium]|nr:bifunctional DNA primase/polymerase [Gammaproteobacteria bacterium]MYG67125.1 bifunctional DNA primase/polymerase [Gammaproteobacteria bacterium]
MVIDPSGNRNPPLDADFPSADLHVKSNSCCGPVPGKAETEGYGFIDPLAKGSIMEHQLPYARLNRTTVRAAALDYIQRKWPVLPIRRGAKIPACRNGLKDASTDPEQIKAWWPHNDPDRHDIAVAFPGMVLDLVIPKGGGENQFTRAGKRREVLRKASYITRFQKGPAWVVVTPSGGLHLYFSPDCPLDLVRYLKEIHPDLNGHVLGVGQSYCLVPPSIGYRWIPGSSSPLPASDAEAFATKPRVKSRS